jgi:hypothetical protein
MCCPRRIDPQDAGIKHGYDLGHGAHAPDVSALAAVSHPQAVPAHSARKAAASLRPTLIRKRLCLDELDFPRAGQPAACSTIGVMVWFLRSGSHRHRTRSAKKSV